MMSRRMSWQDLEDRTEFVEGFRPAFLPRECRPEEAMRVDYISRIGRSIPDEGLKFTDALVNIAVPEQLDAEEIAGAGRTRQRLAQLGHAFLASARPEQRDSSH